MRPILKLYRGYANEQELIVMGHVFKPTTKAVTYYFTASWEKEQDALKTQEEFLDYLNSKLDQLNSKNKL